MKTAPFFVELLVIGFETVVWMFMLIISFFGISWINFTQISATIVWLPAVTFAYVFGIIIDRICDNLIFGHFEWRWKSKIVSEYSGKDFTTLKQAKDEWVMLRIKVYSASSPIVNLLNYQLHRLRIMRSSVINFLLITLFSFIFLVKMEGCPALLIVVVTIGGLLISGGSFYSWKKLSKGYVKTVCRASLNIAGNNISSLSKVDQDNN